MIYLHILLSLLITVFIEGLIVLLVLKSRQIAYYSVLCNVLTNPALNLLLILAVNYAGAQWYALVVIVLELAAAAVEAGVYKYLCGFSARRALLLSAVLNVASFVSGLIITAFY